MSEFRYIKGSAFDFEGAPDWATHKIQENNLSESLWAKDFDYMCKAQLVRSGRMLFNIANPTLFSIIAQRERVEYDHLNDLPLVSEKCPNKDNVNHPSHYTQGGIECIDAIKAATVGKKPMEAVCVANIVKYLWRYEEKNGLEDVKKAR
jgi:hypothetical protein